MELVTIINIIIVAYAMYVIIDKLKGKNTIKSIVSMFSSFITICLICIVVIACKVRREE